MLTSRPAVRIGLGLVLAAMGVLWTLQGVGAFGQDGGMNGRTEWIVIGAIAAVAGLALAASGYRARSRP